MIFEVYADGGCNNATKSNAYFSFAVFHRDIEKYRKHKKLPEVKTSNVAEYTALISSLEYIHRFQDRNRLLPVWHVFMDSQVIVFQTLGIYSVSQEHLIPLNRRARDLLLAPNLEISLNWIPRKEIFKRLGH